METDDGNSRKRHMSANLRGTLENKRKRFSYGGGRNNTRRREYQNSSPRFYNKHQKIVRVDFNKLKEWSNKQSHEIIVELLSHKNDFEDLLGRELNNNSIVLVLDIIAKVLSSSFHQNKVDIMNLVLRSNFISRLKNYIIEIPLQDESEREENTYFWNCIEEIFTNLLTLCKYLVETNPTNKSLQTIFNAIANIGSIEISDELKENFASLQQILTLKLDNKNSNSLDSFRYLSIYPTSKEITTSGRSFIRPHIIDGPYESVDHYLDIQFRLLKEDFVAPLRESVCKFINGRAHTGGKSNVKIYSEVEFISVWTNNNKLGALLQFTTNENRRNYKTLKRLMYGSLVCFTKNNFETVIFGRIIERNPELLSKGQVVVGFEPGFETYELDQPYIMVECNVYFEPYYHVLKTLQKLDETNFPMKSYIIHVNPNIAPPLTTFNPPNVGLNDSQYSAYKAALTQKFIVIQGPPGTGKTYLGLKITKALIEKQKNVFNPKPILVVSYTNHALDQFLEGLLDTTTEIVRVGGQSKNKNLENLNLKFHRRGIRRVTTNKALYMVKNDVCNQLSYVRNINKTLDKIDEHTGVLNFRHFIEVEPDLANSWFATASDEEIKNWLLGDRHNRQNYMDIQRPQWEEQNDVQNGEQDNMDKELDELFHAENRQNKEIDDDFDFKEPLVQPIKFNQLSYLLTISEMNTDLQNIWEEIEEAYDIYNYRDHRNLRRERNELEVNLNYLQMRLETGKMMKSPSTTFKPINCDLNHPDEMSANDRWKLYFHWVELYKATFRKELLNYHLAYQKKYNQFMEFKDIDDAALMRDKFIIGMTTTGAARLQKTLQELKCETVIVEEAAEILESHIIASLTLDCKRLILIGDHQQLKPSTADYCIEQNYNLGVSLFERMVRNNIQCHVLGVQHRMRPEITKLIVPSIYPTLENHPSVFKFPSVSGMDRCVYFINHNHPEQESNDTSKVNPHEVTFLIKLARYLVQNGYEPRDITILTAYSGQMFSFWRERSKHPIIHDVYITSLDNYQGEENKIILLSLVRNNEENKIGFLKIENRVCVALSRAREGLYIMGNMDLLCRNSPIWLKVKESLVSQDFLGDQLPLRCQIHTDVVTTVKSAEDFLMVPEGGCKNMCAATLDCGHTCPGACHPINREHQEILCKKKCLRTCKNKHRCFKKCFENCELCKILVHQKLTCTHECSLPCYMDPEDYKCTILTKVKLPCGHEVSNKPCFQDINIFKCPMPCNGLIEPCGHNCKRICHVRDDPDHLKYKCQRSCERPRLNCCTGTHMCPSKCYQQCLLCKVLISKTRTTCSHKSLVECSIDVDEVLCEQRCQRVLSCGHKCKGKCGEPCGKCERKIKKKLIECGHKIKIRCCDKPSLKFCKGNCSKILNCGHQCRNKCNESCTNRCQELVEYSCPEICEHDYKIKCYLTNKEVPNYKLVQFCTEPCNIILGCSHKCSGSCGECAQGRIHKICIEKCEQLLLCGHKCLLACHLPCRPSCRACYKCPHLNKPCGRCFKNCTRQCRHVKCEAKCGEICTVPPCIQPCYKQLPCSHHCVGFCGDPCPPLCRICHKTELTRLFLGYEDEKGARFVLLDECKHVVESQGMEAWLQQDDHKIESKTCPKCKIPLTSTQRYSDYIKRTMEDLAKVEEQCYGDRAKQQIEFFTKVADIEKNCNKLYEYLPLLFKLFQYFKNKSQLNVALDITLIRTFFSKIQIIENITEQFNKVINETVNHKIIDYINFLLEYLIKHMTNKNTADFEKELLRLARIIELCLIEKHSNFEFTIKHKPEVKMAYEEINKHVFAPIAYSEDLEKDLKAKLTNLNEEIQAYSNMEIDPALDMPWFKCPKGHYYTVTEGSAEKCYECEEENEENKFSFYHY